MAARDGGGPVVGGGLGSFIRPLDAALQLPGSNARISLDVLPLELVPHDHACGFKRAGVAVRHESRSDVELRSIGSAQIVRGAG